MTTHNSNLPATREGNSRGTISSFDSLLRIADAKASEIPREVGTGSAVLYLRVSTQRQMMTAIDLDPDGNSIATQRESTINRAKRLKVPVIKEFVEPGQSAQSIAKRPVFRELLHYVENTPDVEYVIIYMRSRVFRNQTDAAITKRILDSMGVKLISAKEEFGEGYMADAMEAITDIMNEVQVRQSGEDIKNKMYHKAKNGGTIGRARIGYLNVRKDVDGHLVNSIDIDPDRAPLITWAFEQYATGEYSLTRLQSELELQGLTTRKTTRWDEKIISRSKLGTILRDPYYLGMVVYKGEVFPGKHPALVKPEVFEKVQQVLDIRAQRNQRDVVHNHFLRAMMRCRRCYHHGRNRQLLFGRANNPRSGVHDYYFCSGRQDKTCDLPYLPIAMIEDHMKRELENLRLLPEEVTMLRVQVDLQIERHLSSERSVRDRTKKELAQLENKEDRLLDLAADGTMDVEKIRERLGKIRVQKARLEERLSSTDEVVRRESQLLLNYLTLLESPGEFYAAAHDDVKRKLLRAFFLCIWIDDTEHEIIVDAEAREPLAHIRNAIRSERSTKQGIKQALDASDKPNSTLLSLSDCSSKTNLVPGTGLEPAQP